MATHDPKFKCKTCGKCFARRCYLKNHVERENKNIQFDCNKCSRSFKSSRQLYRHQQEKHVNKRKFKCTQCEAAFPYQFRLTEHVEVDHNGKRYRCSYPRCSLSFTFNAKGNAVNHLRIHLLNGNEWKAYSSKIILK